MRIVVETPFVSGKQRDWLFPSDLIEWQNCLDVLDAGQEAAWREHVRGAALSIERDEEGECFQITVSGKEMTFDNCVRDIPAVRLMVRRCI
ncbi:DUF5959 family protein [Streptomyces sp. NRRL F-5126]|uniref:DUF5959 family protein n=1 Tax=Streptomyces sp. NRRL F-5126 TaxID=1463857 RepID=UPI003B632838